MRTNLFLSLSLAALCTVAGSAAVTGCSHSHAAAGTQPALITSPNSPIADVPIPAGFSMVTSQSISQVVQSSGLRFVDHQYTGGDDVLPVVRFYRDELPSRGWTLVDQDQLKHEITLHFTKNSENLAVSVWSGTLDTHIRIKIDPAGRDAAH